MGPTILRTISSKSPPLTSYSGKRSYITPEEVMDRLLSEDNVMLVSSGNYREAKEALDEFKRRRMQLGRPVRKFYDPETAKKDLEGEEFFTLMDETKRKKKK